MARMKKFLLYFVMFAGLFLFVEFFTNVSILNVEEKYVQLDNYEIKTELPKIEVTEFMGNNSSGYIKGNITNNTGEHIKDKYLKFGFYNKSNNLVAAKYQEIKYFNVDEKINFNIDFNYKDIQKVQIELVDEIEQIKTNSNIQADKNSSNNNNDVFELLKPEITEETIKIAIPIVSVMTAIYVCNIFAL